MRVCIGMYVHVRSDSRCARILQVCCIDHMQLHSWGRNDSGQCGLGQAGVNISVCHTVGCLSCTHMPLLVCMASWNKRVWFPVSTPIVPHINMYMTFMVAKMEQVVQPAKQWPIVMSDASFNVHLLCYTHGGVYFTRLEWTSQVSNRDTEEVLNVYFVRQQLHLHVWPCAQCSKDHHFVSGYACTHVCAHMTLSIKNINLQKREMDNRMCGTQPTPICLGGVCGLPQGVGIAVVACGAYHSLVGTAGGQLFAFGQNSFGQLGIDGNRAQVCVVLPKLALLHLM